MNKYRTKLDRCIELNVDDGCYDNDKFQNALLAIIQDAFNEGVVVSAALVASKTTCKEHSLSEMRNSRLICGNYLRLADKILDLQTTFKIE